MTAVGLDSGYVHDCRPDSEGSFEVVIGRILSKNKGSRSLGFVYTIECNHTASNRLMKRLCELGPKTDDVTVLTDGDLVALDNGEATCGSSAPVDQGTHALSQEQSAFADQLRSALPERSTHFYGAHGVCGQPVN